MKAGKPDANRKPGGEGLPYKDADGVCGGPIQEQPQKGLGPDYEVKGDKSLPSVRKK